jgi:hypothetical protein
MHNRLGLTSISANYISLYVNDEYIGMYILMDAPKVSWAELEFGDENTGNLYKCKSGGNALTVKSCATGCTNENDEITDTTEWVEFLTAMDNAQSAEDIEDIFDVDQFLYEIAFEYLSGSWDHFVNTGHNFDMYKNPKTGKWTIIYYDFDGELGQDVNSINMFGQGNQDYPSYTFEEYANRKKHIFDILIFNDPTRFENILKNFVTEVFNPATLFPHIDELKKFIKPHIIKDKTPDENGKCPGMLNEKGSDYSIEEWDANSEFTNLSGSYGLKYWILAKYRYICKAYDMECDPVYMDENYEYSINKEVEGNVNDSWFMPKNNDDKTNNPPTNPPKEDEPKENGDKPTDKPTDKEDEQAIKCWAEFIGYPCCSEKDTYVYDTDSYGDWSYDFDNNEWCGLTPYEEPQNDEECWSEIIGYSCCKGCTVYEEDEFGKWGYEKNHWCGIQSFCKA